MQLHVNGVNDLIDCVIQMCLVIQTSRMEGTMPSGAEGATGCNKQWLHIEKTQEQMRTVDGGRGGTRAHLQQHAEKQHNNNSCHPPNRNING